MREHVLPVVRRSVDQAAWLYRDGQSDERRRLSVVHRRDSRRVGAVAAARDTRRRYAVAGVDSEVRIAPMYRMGVAIFSGKAEIVTPQLTTMASILDTTEAQRHGEDKSSRPLRNGDVLLAFHSSLCLGVSVVLSTPCSAPTFGPERPRLPTGLPRQPETRATKYCHTQRVARAKSLQRIMQEAGEHRRVLG